MNIEHRTRIILKLIPTHTVKPFSSLKKIRDSFLLTTPLYTYNDFVKACNDNNVDLVKTLLVHDTVDNLWGGTTYLDPTFKNSDCLIQSVENNNTKIVYLLIQDGRVNVCTTKHVCFRTIYSKGYHNLFNILFYNIPLSKKNKNKQVKRLKMLQVMMKHDKLNDSNLIIFRHILHFMKTLDTHDDNLLFNDDCHKSCISAIQCYVLNAAITNQFEIIKEYFNYNYTLEILLLFIDSSIKSHSLERFNFLLDYSLNNRIIYDMRNDIFRLLKIATMSTSTVFVKLFLSLITCDQLSHEYLTCLANTNYPSIMSISFMKEIEDDTINIFQIYIQDGRMDVTSTINIVNLTGFYAQKKYVSCV